MDSVDVEALSNEQLRDLLIKHGQSCGPVVKTTRKVYENKLKRVLSNTSKNVPVSVQATPSPASDRLSATNSSSGSSRRGAGNRSDYFGDASDHYDDEKMEGEESFRYVGPVNDSPPSPYSALGGSMIATPPAPPRPAPSTTTTSISSRLDYGLGSQYSPPKPSSNYAFTTNRTPISKSSTISYHTVGYTPEPYRRSLAPAAVAPRVAAPTIPYGSSNSNKRFTSTNWDFGEVTDKAKTWGPGLLKIFIALLLIIFVVMLINRAMQTDSDGGDEAAKLPA